MATGIDLLLVELKRKGFTTAKINGNINLIEAVITVLSDEETRKQINLAEKFRDEARQKLSDAEDKERDANRKDWQASEKLNEVTIAERELKDKLQEAKEIKEKIDEALQVETPEARDRVRMYMLFMQGLPKDTSDNQNAVIYGAAAILSGQTVFTATAKPNKQ